MSRSHKRSPCCNWVGVGAATKRFAKRASNRYIRRLPIGEDIPSGKGYRHVGRRASAYYAAFLKEWHPWETELEWYIEAPEEYGYDLAGTRRVWERLYYAK